MRTLSVYELVEPFDARLKHERAEAFVRLVACLLVGLLAFAIIVIGGGYTYTGLRHVLTPVLAVLSGVLLHAAIALGLYLYMEGRNNLKPPLRIFGASMYGGAAGVLALVACARAAYLTETRPLLSAFLIALAIFSLEMLLATGSALWLHLAMDAYKAASQRLQRTKRLRESLLASRDKEAWYRRYYEQTCQAARVLEEAVHAAYDLRTFQMRQLEMVTVEQEWIELNAPVDIVPNMAILVEPPRSLAGGDPIRDGHPKAA